MTTSLSNFDKRWSDAHFVSFIFHYYCIYFKLWSFHIFKYDVTTNIDLWLISAWYLSFLKKGNMYVYKTQSVCNQHSVFLTEKYVHNPWSLMMAKLPK